jgi:26S proteasome regulatory subunit T3
MTTPVDSDTHTRTLYEEVKRQESLKLQLKQRIEYNKIEYHNLLKEILRAEEELKRMRAPPLMISQFVEMVDKDHGIVSTTLGTTAYVRVMSTIDRQLLKPNASVACHRHSEAVVEVLPPESDSTIQLMTAADRPDVSYADIGFFLFAVFSRIDSGFCPPFRWL